MQIDRVVLIVLDGVGVGAAPDAAKYGDQGSNSVGNVSRVLGGIDLPNMGQVGLGGIIEIEGVPPADHPTGGFGKMSPQSAGKDTVSGHWELMGIYLPEPFPTYPDGFPDEVLTPFVDAIGRGVIGNKAASGTVIIQELGEEHVRTGKPIVYTSADSVFQIAAHEEVIPLDELYQMCRTAREILTGKHGVGRVIARPFIGESKGAFTRTNNRKDFARIPDTATMMDKLVNAGMQVYSVGKIDDIFGHRGITKGNHTSTNADSIQATLDFLDEDFKGLMFINLIEFDMIYGHRNDPEGYYKALKQFDDAIPDIQARLRPSDIVIISADHGVDPTTESTDHSREFVPLLVFGQPVKGVNLGARSTLSDVAATLAEIFNLEPPTIGASFLKQIL
ncbi:phosphopentomutase [Chloroflexota bacterium]